MLGMNEPTAPARRRRPIADIPHMQVSEVQIIDVPAVPGVAAHKDYLVTTACGQEKNTTLITRTIAKVRCTDCLAAMGIPAALERATAYTAAVAACRANPNQATRDALDDAYRALRNSMVAAYCPHPEAARQPLHHQGLSIELCWACNSTRAFKARLLPERGEWSGWHRGLDGWVNDPVFAMGTVADG